MDQMLHIGADETTAALKAFCAGKLHIVLVTDGAAYSLCGAEKFFNDFFQSLVPNPQPLKVTHLAVPLANPKVETVQPLLDVIQGPVDGFIAVGGGTTIDTTKLLNLAWITKNDIKSILYLHLEPPPLLPYLALPTTAGTGAEATRFAVCYDGEIKYSIDFLSIRPSEVALMPDFIASLPKYQKLSTNFDAYAQAVESLWAKGATDESKQYAQKALNYMQKASDCEQKSERMDVAYSPRLHEEYLLAQLLASYWAGRAIDISRTTAAHAFSYYLTSHYGIPHGHAVYMVFPYICRNNGRPDCIKVVPGLKTLRELCNEKGIFWSQMVDDLFAHVNLKRLGNNPVEVRKESFKD